MGSQEGEAIAWEIERQKAPRSSPPEPIISTQSGVLGGVGTQARFTGLMLSPVNIGR